MTLLAFELTILLYPFYAANYFIINCYNLYIFNSLLIAKFILTYQLT